MRSDWGEPNGAVPGATVAGVRRVLLAPLRGVGMAAQATEEQHQTDHMEVSFLSTPYALSAGDGQRCSDVYPQRADPDGFIATTHTVNSYVWLNGARTLTSTVSTTGPAAIPMT